MGKILACFCVFAFSTEIFADSFRCGRVLVKIGDSSSTLLKKCGDPLRKYSSKELIKQRGSTLNTSVSNWVYPRRGNQDKVVSIRNGQVVKIQVR